MHFFKAAVAVFLMSVMVPAQGMAQGSGNNGLVIQDLLLVSEERVSVTHSNFTYRAVLRNNSGTARPGLTATVASAVSFIEVIGNPNIHFAPVPANGQVTSMDTFTILMDRQMTFERSNLVWSFNAPFANAGPGRTASVGEIVTLNGGASTNPSGLGTLTYSWTLLSRPPGTATRLTDATSVMPQLLIDVPGEYLVRLTVSNGFGSDTATVTISTNNTSPVANAGPNQTVATGAQVFLNGSGSSDVDGNPLTFSWSLLAKPQGSTAVLSSTSIVNPVFTADKPGVYIAQLIVNDGKVNSAPASVTITTQNTPPVANAGSNQTVSIGTNVQLNGSGSTDVDGDPITYQWSLITRPANSNSTLSNATIVNPTFVADQPGAYIAQLIVSDGKTNSNPATVTITINAVQPPTANAGPNQTVRRFDLVTLNGSGTDPQSLPLTFSWSLTSRPGGSQTALSSSTAANPTFTADVAGTYVAQLIVNNGFLASAPATVTINTTNSAPVANAGPDQTVNLATVVSLSGSLSSDADQDPLTYSWSFLSRPSGSNAQLSAPTSASPTFLADATGTFVIQLIVNDGKTASDPDTVAITVISNSIIVTPSELNLFQSPGTLTLSIPTPAGPSGQQINLAILDPTVATVPPNVLVPPGANSVEVTVTPGVVGSTLMSASATGLRTTTATINVANPAITITLPASTVGLTRSMQGSVSINASAPAGGTTVSLNSNPPGVVTFQPSTVVIQPGNTSAAFTLTGALEGSALIVGSSAGFSSGAASITVGKLGSILLQSGVVVGPGQSTPIEVTLASAAPAGGAVINLSSDDVSRVTISPSQVTINQGQLAPAVQPQVTGIGLGTATVTASAPGFNGDSKVVTIASALVFNPATINVGAGSTQNATVALSSGTAPAGGITVNLSSSNTGVATVPANVLIPQGSSSVPVPVTGVAAGQATISASPSIQGINGASAVVNVSSTGGIQAPASVSVGLGQTASLAVGLTSNAPQGGVTIALSSANTSIATVAPASVNVPAGTTAPTSQPQVTGAGPGTTTVNVSAPGFGSSNVAVTVTASLSFAPNSVTLVGTETKNLVLTLSGPAPAGGLQVQLQSDNPNLATVPPSVTINAGVTTANVPVTGIAPGNTQVRASAANVTPGAATVTVQSSGAITLPSNVSVAPGQSAAFPVTLPFAPAFNTTVSLSSSDSSKVTVSPAAVLVPAGQTQPAVPPQVTGVNFGSATITASAAGYVGASQPVNVTGTLSFSQSSVTISGTSLVVTLNLSAAAPQGGLVVNLTSSNPAAVGVAPSVTIPQNSASISVQLSAAGPGSAVITASAANLTSATLTATVPGSGGGGGQIQLPAGVTLGIGQSAAFPVTLSTPAPAGGVTVNLSSSDSGKVSVTPASVTINQNQTQPAQQPQVTGVAPGSANINATATGYTGASQSVTVTGSFSLTPANLTINGLTTANLTVNLSGPAPSGGITVTLTSSQTGVATVPATVQIQQNATSAQFAVTAVGAGTSTITATAPGLGQTTATVTVQTGADIILPKNLVVAPGESVTFPIQLAAPAAQSTFVALSVSDPSKATLNLQNILINAGQTQPTTQPRLTGVAAGTVTIEATAIGLITATTTARVGFAISFTPNTVSIIGTATQNLTLTLTAPAPQGGVAVALSSSNPAVATVPANVNFGTNSTTVSVPVTGVTAGTAIIRASVQGMEDATADVTVTNPGSITLGALSAQLGTPIPITVSLSTPAPFGGVNITLSSANQDQATVAPATVFVPAGQTQPTSTPMMEPVNVGGVNITASAPGYASATVTAQIGTTIQWEQQNVAIPIGESRNVFLRMGAMAPWPPGLVVTLTSSNPAIARVQPSVNFIGDGSNFTANNIVIHGDGPGTATITAQGINIPPSVLTVIVSGPLTINTTSLPNGSVGAPYSQALSAGGGNGPYTWSLTSGSLPANLTLNPNTGVISGTPLSQANATPLTIRVTDSSSPAQQATVNLALTIGPQVPASIQATGGTPQSAIINAAFGSPLSATVRDASNNPIPGVTVTFTAPVAGASGTFAGGSNTAVTNGQGVATSGVFMANGSTGSYTVTAAVNGLASTASFALTNTNASALVVPPSTTLTLGQVAPFAVSLSNSSQSDVTITLTSSDPRVTITPGTVVIPAGQTTPASQPQITGVNLGSATINATAPGFSSASGTVQVSATISLSPQNLNVNTGQSQNLTLTLSAPAPAGGLTFNISSSNPAVATVPATVQIAGGSTSTTISVAGVANGSTVVTAAHPNLTSATANVSVVTVLAITTTSLPNGKTGSPYSATLAATGGTPPLTWLLTSGTLPAGLSLNAQTGAITGTPTTPVTALALSFRATDSGSPAQVANVNLALTISAPVPTSITVNSGSLQSTRVGTAFANPLVATVRDQDGVVMSGITVTFTAPTIPGFATATFTGGLSVVTVQTDENGVATTPQLTANNKVGGYNINATVPQIAGPGIFLLANTAGPAASIGTVSGTPQVGGIDEPYPIPLVAAVRDADGNGVSGRPVTFTVIPGTNGAGATFTGNALSIETITDSFGRATTNQVLKANSILGDFVVTATTPGFVNSPAIFNLRNELVAPPPPTLSLTGASVGKDLQTTLVLVVSSAADVLLTSSDPTRLLVSERPNVPGAPSVLIPGVAGGVPTLVTVQGLADSGSVTVRAEALGLTATATVTLTPSGFVLAGPNGLGQSFSLPQGASVPLTISSARLNSSRMFEETQPVRTGLAVQVSLTQAPQVGQLAPQITFTGPQSEVIAPFLATTGGSASTITAQVPPGFSQPATGNTLTAIVTQAKLTAANVSVGKNLQVSTQLLLDAPAPQGLAVTIQSNNPAKFLLAKSADEAGSAAITLIFTEEGRTSTPPFFIQGLDSSGSATFTATASGYSSADGTVTLRPSGFALASPVSDVLVNVGAPNVGVTVTSVMINGDLTNTEQPLRANIGNIQVNVVSSNPAIGAIIGAPLVFTSNSSSRNAEFAPLSRGTTTISVQAPAGFILPNPNSRQAEVLDPRFLILNTSTDVGNRLQRINVVSLTSPAPAGGLTATITSNNPGLVISGSATTAGTAVANINIPAGQTSFNFYMQGAADTGTATYTVSIPGYKSNTGALTATGSVTLLPSGVVIQPNGIGQMITIGLGSGPLNLTLATATLDPDTRTLLEVLPLAGGQTITVPLGNSNGTVGSIASSVQISGGNDSVVTAFTPAALGDTTITVTQPAGFSIPTNRTSQLIRVN